MTLSLRPQLLTREGFAPFGDVIDSAREDTAAMNDQRFERFDDLCGVDIAEDGRVAVSIARCRVPTELPIHLELVERHPLGSQAFIPLSPCRMLIVVAPPGDSVDTTALRAFVTDGRQGFNYHRGTWHMPLVGFEAGQEYLVIDRAGDVPNCETLTITDSVVVEID